LEHVTKNYYVLITMQYAICSYMLMHPLNPTFEIQHPSSVIHSYQRTSLGPSDHQYYLFFPSLSMLSSWALEFLHNMPKSLDPMHHLTTTQHQREASLTSTSFLSSPPPPPPRVITTQTFSPRSSAFLAAPVLQSFNRGLTTLFNPSHGVLMGDSRNASLVRLRREGRGEGTHL